MRRQDFIPISDVVRRYGEREEMKEGRLAIHVEKAVRDYFGEILLRYVSEIKYEGGVLTIKTSSAPFRANLMMERERMITKLCGDLGAEAIREIRILF